jgi:hypothetical protein
MVVNRQRGKSVYDAMQVGTDPTITIATSSASRTVTAIFPGGEQIGTSTNRMPRAYHYWLAGDSLGTALVDAEVGGASAGAAGLVIPTSTGNFVSGIAVTNSTGHVAIVLTTTGTSTYWMGFILPGGRVALSTSFPRTCG